MVEYISPYTPVVPRILPSQSPSKIFPISEDRYPYQHVDNHSPIVYTNPSNAPPGPLSTRAQLNHNELSPISSNNIDKGRLKKGLYHEPLKDNSGDFYPNNYSPNGYQQYPGGHYHDYPRMRSFEDNPLKCSKALIITFGIIIGLFSLTALTISIYLLVRFSSFTST
ncbi:hypothetical protein I4U23_004835 [Adineta vaga]|nr:hypothetical protein I4U23_004835 [Adineta vaga]